MASRMIASRLAAASVSASAAGNTASRALSSQGTQAVERLRHALQEYRAENYTRCIPSRFQKDIVKAAQSGGGTDNNLIAVHGMQRVISNIRMEHIVSHADVETIFREIGSADKMIPADRLMQMIA